MLMTEYMNKPVFHTWTDEEIRQEYGKYRDKKKVAKVFRITTNELNRILEIEN